jgi:pimeloyl-ACP methyl ester carboxylesterase
MDTYFTSRSDVMLSKVSVVPSADGTDIAIHSLGVGEAVLVVGGALRSAEDYLPFARTLGDRFAVHVLDRRGRGASGRLGPHYALERECEDLAAALVATRAWRVFGHSYGGLVALHAARQGLFQQVAVYEPAVSANGSARTGWLDDYQRRLSLGDTRGAFVEFVRGSGHAPPALARMPSWYVRLVLRAAVRRASWRRIAPLLEADLLEHREVARFEGDLAYRELSAPVLLLAGDRSPRSQTQVLQVLAESMPSATLEVMPGLDHLAPEGKGRAILADRVARFFSAMRPLPSPTPSIGRHGE